MVSIKDALECQYLVCLGSEQPTKEKKIIQTITFMSKVYPCYVSIINSYYLKMFHFLKILYSHPRICTTYVPLLGRRLNDCRPGIGKYVNLLEEFTNYSNKMK